MKPLILIYCLRVSGFFVCSNEPSGNVCIFIWPLPRLQTFKQVADSYLANIDRQAQKCFKRLIEGMKQIQGKDIW